LDHLSISLTGFTGSVWIEHGGFAPATCHNHCYRRYGRNGRKWNKFSIWTCGDPLVNALYIVGMMLPRYRLRDLLITVAAVALVLGSIVFLANLWHSLYYVQVGTVRSALAEHPEIENVWVCTNDDVELEVEALFFTIAGRPGEVLGIGGIDGASKSKILEELHRALREDRPTQIPAYAESRHWAGWK
jgi:hypothetical protein